jgi:hypothetical protein
MPKNATSRANQQNCLIKNVAFIRKAADFNEIA